MVKVAESPQVSLYCKHPAVCTIPENYSNQIYKMSGVLHLLLCKNLWALVVKTKI